MTPAPHPDPKIELHVHLEGTVRPDALRRIAARNGRPLPPGLPEWFDFRDFGHFVEVWNLITSYLRTADDFRGRRLPGGPGRRPLRRRDEARRLS